MVTKKVPDVPSPSLPAFLPQADATASEFLAQFSYSHYVDSATFQWTAHPSLCCPDHGFGIGRLVVTTGPAASPGPRPADSERPLGPLPREKEDNKSLENNAGSGSRARPALGINICYESEHGRRHGHGPVPVTVTPGPPRSRSWSR